MATIRKAAIGAVWVAARIASRQLANAAVFFWLAFELDPAELGVAALAVAPALFALPLVTNGLREALIQRETLEPRTVSTALAVNAALGLALCLLLLVLAPAAGRVFGDDRLPALAALAAAIPLLAALGSPLETLRERAFDYRRITLIHMAAALCAAAAAVTTVSGGAPVWALVVFAVASHATVSGLMWLTGRPRDLGRPDRAEARRLLRFAAPVMASQTLAVGNQRIVEMLTGALVSPAAAAFLRFGSNVTRLLNQLFVTPVIQVLMPAFARSRASSGVNLFRVLAVNAAVLFFVFMLVAALAPELISAVFGPDWAPAGAVAAALCFGVYAALIGPVAYPLLVVKEKGDWTVWLSLAGVAVMVVFVAAGSAFGALGAAWGFALRGVLTVPMTLWVLRRALEIPPRRVLAACLPFAVAASVMYLALEVVAAPLLAGWPVAAGLAAQVAAGAGLYWLLLRLGLRRWAPEPWEVLRGVLPGRLRGLL